MIILFVIVSVVAINLFGSDNVLTPMPNEVDFGSYWFQGQAEITRFSLEQVRYGEIHNGDAVLIFVTEDFLPDKQIKYEYGNPPADLEKVLKLNFTRKFSTGIYPYSIMTSIFTPLDIENKNTLKVTSSVQEWCGHTFMQLNYRDKKYKGMLHSYFQNEGDQEFQLADAVLEDEIWAKIRLNPQLLPTGGISIIPGLQYQRLLHTKPEVAKAIAFLETISDPSISENELFIYRVIYQNLPRSLEIKFEQDFPYEIVAWEEKNLSSKDPGDGLITRAVKTHLIQIDYWNKNSVEDKVLLRELGLNDF
jgi:hypothetical protein